MNCLIINSWENDLNLIEKQIALFIALNNPSSVHKSL